MSVSNRHKEIVGNGAVVTLRYWIFWYLYVCLFVSDFLFCKTISYFCFVLFYFMRFSLKIQLLEQSLLKSLKEMTAVCVLFECFQIKFKSEFCRIKFFRFLENQSKMLHKNYW